MNNHQEIIPIGTAVPADRQAAKRHYGVHPYFTRRPFNVIRKYILHYSNPGEVVLDPFGGSGVTAIEAFLENRIGIQNDINPLANFIAEGIYELSKGNLADYKYGLAVLKDRCYEILKRLPQLDDQQIKTLQKKLNLPPNIPLPTTSDVEYYHDLFSVRQLTALAVLKDAIDALDRPYARKGLLLAWSATLAKLNKTFLSTEGRAESRGGSSIFSIYRYKIAKEPIELPPWETFYERATNIIAAKKEIDAHIEYKRHAGGFSGHFKVKNKDIESLAEELKYEVDYIFTDPPYGGHISYLDLSTLWNCWLDQMPTKSARKMELIVGGELQLSEQHYTERLATSIEACLKMLKKGRWLSVVFQHWNVTYFSAILSTAADHGAELKAAISQVGDPIWSMHKKKGNQSVLAGEMILTFQKTGKREVLLKSRSEFDVGSMVKKILTEANSEKIYGEYLFNQLVIAAWQQSSISSLNITKDEFSELIKNYGWHYDQSAHYWVKEKDRVLRLFAHD
ncbi:MAG TPA: DNA methyltransferase [Pyrinomonadaceae bacterium]